MNAIAYNDGEAWILPSGRRQAELFVWPTAVGQGLVFVHRDGPELRATSARLNDGRVVWVEEGGTMNPPRLYWPIGTTALNVRAVAILRRSP